MEIKKYVGHIRNYKKLCVELGIDPKLDRKDREELILKKGYEKWGLSLFNRLHGMFAFAIVDGDKTILVRDHFGTKPFYYYSTITGRLLYSSQIRELMTDREFVKELREDLLQIYLSFTYLPGDDTLFKGVKKLLPGHYLISEAGKFNIVRYYEPKFEIDDTLELEKVSKNINEVLKEIFSELEDEEQTTISFLSGGVDSSYVFAMSKAQFSASCGYKDERFDESHLARQTSELLGRENFTKLITEEEYFNEVPHVMREMEQPLADASAIAFTLGCRAAGKHAKICYSGEGADEFFGGYNIYKRAFEYGNDLEKSYVGNTNIMKEEDKKLLLKKYYEGVVPSNYVKDLYDKMKDLDNLSKMELIDIMIWLEGDIYLNVDKMSRAEGVEILMPFTDRRIFDIARKLPSRLKIDDNTNKIALRKASTEVLPDEIAYRKKMGFVVPIRVWLADARYNQDVIRLLNSEIAEKFFNLEEVNKIIKAYLAGESDYWRKIWTIYTFLVWYEIYFESDEFGKNCQK